VGVAEYLVVRSAQLSSDWIDGFQKNLLRALFIGWRGDMYQRIMDLCALFEMMWHFANYLS